MNALPRPPTRRFRLIAALGTALLCGLAASAVARAQTEATSPDAAPTAEAPADAPKPASVDDFGKPMGPVDPFNRGTPRGSMYGFLKRTRGGQYEEAAQFLDLRRLPASERERGADFARQLKVVLDQKLWVDLVNLSDSNDGHADDDLPAWQDRLGDIETSRGSVSLLLQRVPREGDSVRIWKVAASTVAEVPELYAEFQPVWVESLLPQALSEIDLLGTALWKWLGLAVLLVIASAIALLIGGTTTRILAAVVTRRHEHIDSRLVHHFQGPARLALTVVFFAIGQRFLGLSLGFLAVLKTLEKAALVIAFVWFVLRLIDLVILAARMRAEREERSSVLPVLTPASRLVKFLVWALGLLALLGAFGVNVTAVVAGLGIGGLAVALAAQKSLENLLGGINLFADQPVRVGDFCRYGDQIGTVEDIGLRSTRIRSLDRTVVTIPNSEFSSLKLENFALRDRMRLWTMIGVRYETTPEQLRYVLARLREVLIAHPRVTDDPCRVRFVGFGAYSLDLEVFAYVNTSDNGEFLGIREDIYLRFMDVIKEAGTGFAFPSSTMYFGRDDPPDADEADRVGRTVAEWRKRGDLPLPQHSPEAYRAIENTLDWPPEGSPDRLDGKR